MKLLPNLLFVLFLGLKLTGHIDWSWWWVFAPLWGYALLSIAIGFVIGFDRATKKQRGNLRREREGRGQS